MPSRNSIIMRLYEHLEKDDFVNPDVLNTIDPHPVYGYAHGPIPPDNLVPTTSSEAYRASQRATTSGSLALNPAVIPICGILITDNVMCGCAYAQTHTLATHYRHFHNRETYSIRFSNNAPDYGSIGANAVKLWVLKGGWRDALYDREPGGKSIEVLQILCDTLENIARNDAEFAAEYGTQFHRPHARPLAPRLPFQPTLPSNASCSLAKGVTPKTSFGSFSSGNCSNDLYSQKSSSQRSNVVIRSQANSAGTKPNRVADRPVIDLSDEDQSGRVIDLSDEAEQPDSDIEDILMIDLVSSETDSDGDSDSSEASDLSWSSETASDILPRVPWHSDVIEID